MKKNIVTTLGLAVALFAASEASALPTSATLTANFAARVTSRDPEDATISLRGNTRFSTALESGESCEVEFAVCLTDYVPAGQSSSARECRRFVIGSKAAAEGATSVRFNTSTNPVKAGPSGSRQVNIQSQATCTDGSTTSVLTTRVRAFKVSRSDGRGVSPNRFRNQLADSFR